ncbi:MAG: acylphosphatase [Candidatus Diapherotrites archaeon]
MLKRLHATVHGIVQGVFFRAHTAQWARELGLKGYAKNLPEGTVEVVAEGEEEKLKALLGKLEQGSPASKVHKVEVKWLKASNEFRDFSVQR